MVNFCTYSSKIILKYFTISYAIVNDLMSFSNCCQNTEIHFFGILFLYPETLWYSLIVVITQSPSCVRLSATPWTAAHQAFLSLTISWSLLKLMFIELVMPPNHLILCHPLLLLPTTFPSIRVFSNESAVSIRRPKYWSFSFSISLSKDYSGLISFKFHSLISLLSKGLSRVFSGTTIWKHQFFTTQLPYGPILIFIHDYWKNRSFDCVDLCQRSDVSAFQYTV